MAPRPGGRTFRAAVMDAVDSTHASWDRLLDSLPGDLRGFLTAVQPAWWVLRAIVAWLFVQDVRGGYIAFSLPWGFGLVVFVVVSVQLGRRVWGVEPLLSRSVAARLLLVTVNVFALTMLPGAVDRLMWRVADERAYQFAGYEDAEPVDDGLTFQGGQVCDLEVRDSQGVVLDNAFVWDLTSEQLLPMHYEMC